MPAINDKKARDVLKKTCARYIDHKTSQLDTNKIYYAMIHGTFPQAGLYNRYHKDSEFLAWVACQFADLKKAIQGILPDLTPISTSHEACDPNDLSSELSIKPCLEEGYVAPKFILSKLQKLVNLMDSKIKKLGKGNPISEEVCETDPESIKIYKTLKTLNSLIGFAAEYDVEAMRLYGEFKDLLPILEGYTKGVAVKEIKATLDNSAVDDKEALQTVASQLENKTFLEILETNQQSSAERFLKRVSTILIAVGIGIVPTLCMAAKRLYDTGGSSINFFKPLSKNLCEDVKSTIESAHQSVIRRK